MSVNSQKEGEVEEKVAVSFKEKCVNCLKGPNLIKTLIVLVCVATCVEQLTTCISKLVRKPITTHTHFDFNKTLLYPSVTFCREPPYKYSGLQQHSLYPHPYFSSIWRNFPFGNGTLDAVWEDITFTQQDFFVQYGLSASSNNVEVIGTLGLVNGRCFTLKPKILVSQASRATGYSVTLQHTADDLATSTSLYPPGYHVFIHYNREPYTEVEVHNGGLVEYLYVNTGEEVDVKLTVDQYDKLSEEDDLCTHQSNYSANQCTTEYVWGLVEAETGCSGPWMLSDLPRCNNFTAMRNLITAYMNFYLDHDHDHCPRFCQSYLYNSFVTNRQDSYLWDSATKQWAVRSGDAALQTQMYIHFNSMMVSVYEERYNYDWNLFISDLGGSVGFLLGLSVLSLMSIFGKLWSRLIRPSIRPPKSKKDAASISNSILTVDLNPPKTDGFEKQCNDWSSKNESLNL